MDKNQLNLIKNYEITDPRSSINLKVKKEENYMIAYRDQMT